MQHRPPVVKALHGIVRALRRANVIKADLTFDGVVDAARSSTGLSEFGGDDWHDPLQRLLWDYEHSAQLNDLGRVVARMLVVGLLANRLRVASDSRWRDRPPLLKPVFILGLPRTGSTLLHEMLAASGMFAVPRFWQSETLPRGDWSDLFRVARSSARIQLLHVIAPGFRLVHRLGSTLPHECVSIQAISFRSMQFFAIHNVQTYHEWLTDCDWRPAYVWHERYLKILGSLNASQEQPWLLKAPGHMLALDALIERYPDARFVQLHRDPRDVIPSMASLYANLRGACSDVVDMNELGKDVVEEWSRGLKRLANARANKEVNERFVDLDYRALVNNPLACAQSIGARLDIPLSYEAQARMARYLARHPQGKFGKHRYSLAEFGLTAADTERAFSQYIEQYC